jgi:type VI secretion system protein ImpL
MPPGSFDFPGPPADTYTKIVQPACRAATQDLFPFFGSGTGDAPAAEVRRLFGPGGMLPAFFDQRLKPMVATDGPVWRWKPGAPAAFDPATPELLARLPALTALIGNGLDIAIEAVDFGGGVTGAALALPGAELRFDRIGAAATARWTLSDKPADSSLALFKAGRQVRRYQEGGSWSLFRLIGKGPRRAEAWRVAGDVQRRLPFGDVSAARNQRWPAVRARGRVVLPLPRRAMSPGLLDSCARRPDGVDREGQR